MESFKAMALHLLDDLVELRRGPDLVAVNILWSLDLGIGIEQPADMSCTGYTSSTCVHHTRSRRYCCKNGKIHASYPYTKSCSQCK